MKKLLVLCLPLFIVLLSGCEALLLGAASDFNIKVETPEVSIAKGSTGKITLSVSQASPINVLPTPIDIELHNQPKGVSAQPLSIPNGIDKDDLIIEVSSEAAEGGPTDVIIRASNGLKTKEITFKLTITR
jgi:hypothetical protein